MVRRELTLDTTPNSCFLLGIMFFCLLSTKGNMLTWDFFVVVITYSQHISMVIIRQTKCKQNVRKHIRYIILIVLITMHTVLYG